MVYGHSGGAIIIETVTNSQIPVLNTLRLDSITHGDAII